MSYDQNSYLLKFASKTIRRNAGRSFFIIFSVSLAVVIAIWVMSFFDGLNAQIEEAVVNTNTGFYQIQDPEYAETTDSSGPVEYTNSLRAKIETPPVTSASPELTLDANISTPEGSAGLQLISIIPEAHLKFLPLGKKIKHGEFIQISDEYQVVIGEELAKIFKFSVGDQMVLNYQDKSGELRSEILLIKGIYFYNSPGFQKKFIYTNQKTWKLLFLNQDDGKIWFNRIALMTPDLAQGEVIKNKFKEGPLVVKSWKDLNPEMAVVLEFHDGMIKFFFLIIGFTITMTILTPVRMLWQERFDELKMLNIIGVSVKNFWKIGIIECLLMIGLSGLFSLFLLALIIGQQSIYGVDFRYLNDGVSIERAGIKLPGIIYPLLSMNQIFLTFVFVFIVLGSSYLWSIYRTLIKIEGER